MLTVEKSSDALKLLELHEGLQKAREYFNRSSFEFGHHLSDHPLFELPPLLRLSKRVAKPDLYFDWGNVQIGQRWSEIPNCDQPVENLLERIENAGAWVVLRNVQNYEPYKEVLNKLLGEYLSFVDTRLHRHIRIREGIVFVTSPNRISTYHIDRECSLLLQIRGEKTISVFDRYDREVLPETEIERFWAVDNNAATYKEQLQDRADVYELKPGVGIHIPINAPHWVKNHDNVSISLNVNLQFDDKILANIYRANHYLRKLGIAPLPPGQSKVRDSLKAASISCYRGIRSGLKKASNKLRGRSQA
jgi:hypothetical protein